MLTIPASGTIAGAAPSGASEVTCTLNLVEINDSTQAENYTTDQQQLASSAATIYTATADGPSLVRSISVVNCDLVNASTFRLYIDGTAAANAITPLWTLPAGGTATYEDGEWRLAGPDGKQERTGGYARVQIQSFINAGAATYRPTPGMKSCIAIVTGGGGGGGGADTAGGSGDVGVGGGGGAGGTAIGFFSAAQVGASVTLAVGSAGTAGSATNGTSGGNGGDSTWASTVLVGGLGTGGTGSGNSSADSMGTAGGAGGAGSGTSSVLNLTGGEGGPGVGGSCDMATVDLTFGVAGRGGMSFWAGGGRAGVAAVNVLTTDSTNAALAVVGTYGSGGSGGVDNNATTGVAGSVGQAGAIVVIEFIGE